MMAILSLRLHGPAVRLSCSFLVLGIFFAGVYGQPSPLDAVEVLAQRPVSREIESGTKASFLFRAEAGQSIRGSVSQRGSDVIVRVIPEGGRWTAEFDSNIRPEKSEVFEFISDETGVYRIEIEGKRGTPKGSFELTLQAPVAAEDRDRKVHRARVLLSEAASYARAGKYADAIRVAEEVLSIREEVLGPASQDTGMIVNRLGIYHAIAGQTARAFEFTKRALAIYEGDPATDPLILAEVLNNMGVAVRLMGDFAAGEANFKRVIQIREEVFGPEGLALASTLNNLGILYRARGDYEAAEQSYMRSLRIREKHLGVDHPEISLVLNNLAALAYYKGDYSTALTLDQRVLDIRLKTLPSGHPLIGEAIYDVALLLNRMGDRENGEKMLVQALELQEKSFKPDSLQLVKTLATLGNFYREAEDVTRARGYIDRALSIARAHQKGDPLELAKVLLFSARLRLVESDLANAENELTESLAIQEDILGADHIDVRDVLSTLARLYAVRGNLSKAVEAQAKANEIGERQLAVNLNFGTEHQRLAFASLLNADLDQTLAIHAQLGESDPMLREMAAAVLIQRKGRVLDATAGSLASLRAHLKPEYASLLTQLNDTTAQLSALMVSGPRSGGLDTYNARRNALQTRKDEIERELSRRSSGYYVPPKAYSTADVKAVIPQDAALIEYAMVEPEFVAKGAIQTGHQYVAYIVRRDGSTGFVKLGDAGEIDKAVANFRRALHSPSSVDFAKLARKVNDLVLSPVRTRVGPSTHLLISPEGSLSVIPFEALIDDRGKFAVESFHFTYLTSGRDLFRLGGRPASVDPPVVVADPTFGGGASSATSSPSSSAAATRGSAMSVTTAKDLSDVFFAPLVGSAIEARNIRAIFPKARLLTGEAATVTALRELKAPEILHLATHGYFLEDVKGPGAPNQRGDGYQSAVVDNPLIRSGLAFAGANERKLDTDDGLLTAMEASGLNLWGTKLVVLSACDTGLGEIRNGEGVYGLRRSFVLAGAESLVMSLWPVSDMVTRELMTNYYKNLKAGAGRGEALRQVKLAMIKRPTRRHPFYWASFIQSGEWANLDGKR